MVIKNKRKKLEKLKILLSQKTYNQWLCGLLNQHEPTPTQN